MSADSDQDEEIPFKINEGATSSQIVINEQPLNDLEKKVTRLVKTIKNKRNRACYQSVLNYANREETKMEFNEVKVILDNLTNRKLLTDKGKNGRESFFVVEEVIVADSQDDPENGDGKEKSEDNYIIPETQDLDNSIDSGNNKKNGDDDDDNSSDEETDEDFIQKKFYETLTSKIKEEVKLALQQELKLLNTPSHVNELTVVNAEECHSNGDKLYNTLISEITFLRSEISSKDTIIKMLINDRNLNKATIKQEYVKQTDINKLNDVKSPKHDATEKKNKLSDDTHKIDDMRNANANANETSNVDQNEFETVKRRKKKGKRSITILGDSMVKELNPWLMQKKMNNKADKIYSHAFSGAKIDQMHHFANAFMPLDPNLVILHVGTNNLRESTSAENIANDIVKLASSLKNDNNDIMVSSIIDRKDNVREKARQVNNFLKIKCDELNLPYIKHDNITSDTHLKPKGVHLNKTGTSLLASNFITWINT